MARKKDNLFAGNESPTKFEFDENVARVFDDMLNRSVPYYKECQRLVLALATKFLRKGSNVYDLGCSTGTLMKLLGQSLPPAKDVALVGVDNSAPMLARARRKLKGLKISWDLIEADIEKELEMTNASVVIMNYTLQFIPPRRRTAMLKKISNAIHPGGCLILIEKVRAESENLDELFTGGHHEFKRNKGYSKMEIARKRDALDNVLVPLKLSDNMRLMEKAGFRNPEVFFKWMNFAGLLAVKKGRRPKGK